MNEEQTIFNLVHLMDQVTNKMLIRFQQESELSLGISHILVLLELHNKGEQRPSDLAETLGFTPASLTHLATKLIKSDYITLRNDEEDRRTKYWNVTPAGLEVLDKDLDFSLRNKLPLESDLPVRQACSDAFKIIAKISGMKIWAMNDVFWPLGRSCCNETTLCSDHKCIKEPCTFNLMIDLEHHEQCVFSEVCTAYQQGNPKGYYEPIVRTHYY